MKKNKSLLIGFIISLYGAIFNIQSQSLVDSFPEMYNVAWDSQSKDASGSMPIGGGDTGCNVWVEDNELLIYLQRSGIHDEFNGFPKLGRVRFWTSPNIFDGSTSFKQELRLQDGSIEITAEHAVHGDIKIKVWVEVHRPVVHVETISGKELTYYTQYESWRTEPRALDPKSVLGERWGWWDVEGWRHEAILEPDQFKQEDNGMAFYHINPDEKLTSKMAYENMGLGDYYGQYLDPIKDLVWGGWISGKDWVFNGLHEGKYRSTKYSGWRYKTKNAAKTNEVAIVLHTSYSDTADNWLKELDEKRELAKTGIKQAWKKNQKWWAEFWGRSHLVIKSDDENKKDAAWEVGRNYNLFRFMTACNAYGENPTMFNGGLFTFDPELVKGQYYAYHPDWRRWGGGNYTLQNQRWIYWPMLKWGDTEHMKNQFNHFKRVLDVAKLRVRHFYGHEGALYPESSTIYGLPFPLAYGFDSSYIPKRQREKWMDPGASRSASIKNHHTGILELSYMVLEYHRYTGENITEWLPIVKAALDFYDQHYQMHARVNIDQPYDINGKLILFPTSVCEQHFYATNGVPDVSGLQAIVNSALNLPEEWLNTYFEGKEELIRLSKTIPDIHLDEINGDIVIPPAKSVAYADIHLNNEIYLNYPMFPFNQIKLGDKEMDYVHNTYKHSAVWQPVESWEAHVSWTNANVAFARMGMVEKAEEFAYKKLGNGDYRFPAFWGPGYDWAPDHNWGGTGVVGLQEMLMQTTDDKIVLLPTWPKNWNANFKLQAPMNTVVEGKVENGKLTDLKVTPESRRKDVIFWNEQLNK
ncbi:DUF5703 domain-containing protein [Arenibacter certesii]|uniref:DUF5703 domain-containing protein n=1 Tax=Arenibacter certesii TaxID=228955 RepID=A0A918MMV7_9FLAO|nr:DUF5703 domain-containing protein [Arenibacter certesii]GGW41929.1 hypothetical protein GCM10007383_28210 [Arenibacter certesii]